MKKFSSLLLMLVLATFVMAPGWAQADSGFYVSGDLGANFSKSVGFTGDSNDVASHCDFNINDHPDGAEYCGPNDFSYTDTFYDDWLVDFDGGQGILLGTAIGYSIGDNNPQHIFSGVRMEVEYFYRQSRYNQTSKVRGLGISTPTQDKIDRGEFLSGPFETLGSVISHNLFANVFYDFDNDTRFTPYIGVGTGVGITTANWGSNWTRTLNEGSLREGLREDAAKRRMEAADPDTSAMKAAELIDVAGNLEHLAGTSPEANRYISRLAGSSSIANTTLSDTLWGIQILFGVDYTLSERTSLGLKGRWVKFNTFSDSLVWDPLRSHAPNVGLDAPVSGNMTTSDIEFFGISLNMKYHF